jgi:(p)ppGpp synthase/HD superfamily hydrolase
MPSPWSQDLYLKAFHVAARAHRWQLYPVARAGVQPAARMPIPWGIGARIPYIMHLSFVSMEIMAASGAGETFDTDLALQCALLHDTLEDTRLRYGQILDQFGEDVALGVLALTVNKRLPRDEQMPECLTRIRQQPREVWMVKLADRITNLQPPPRHWSKGRIRDYHREAGVILDALHEASPFLADRLRLKINEYAAYAT